MKFSEDFLRKLAAGKITGDFYPFNSGDQQKIDNRIMRILNRIENSRGIRLKIFFEDTYGDCSFVQVNVSKRDSSDTETIVEKKGPARWTKGLIIYISKLSPYWYVGTDFWRDYQPENIAANTRHFDPEKFIPVDDDLWGYDIIKFQKIFEEFDYRRLRAEELKEPLWFDIEIATDLAENKGYRVFDCFFQWNMGW